MAGSRAGKDVAGAWFSTNTHLKFGGTASLFLCKEVAKRLGVSEQEAYANRHANRDYWYTVGKELRENNPGVLLKQCFEHGEVAAGIRDKIEVEYAVKHHEVTDLIWIERDVLPDPTLEFTLSDCAQIICLSKLDVRLHVIINNGSLEDYENDLRRLAKEQNWLK